MAPSYVNIGTASSGTASCTPGIPATPVSGNIFVMLVGSGETSETTPTTLSGWTAPANNSYSGGAGTFGLDTGPRRITVFTKVSDGTESGTVTVSIGGSATGRCISAVILQYSRTGGDSWGVEVTGGSDTTSHTAYSVTGAATLGLTAGDVTAQGTAWQNDTPTVSSQSISVPGCTMAASTGLSSSANTNDNDMRLLAARSSVSSGTATGAPTQNITASAAESGSTAIVRLYEATAAVGIPDLVMARTPG